MYGLTLLPAGSSVPYTSLSQNGDSQPINPAAFYTCADAAPVILQVPTWSGITGQGLRTQMQPVVVFWDAGSGRYERTGCTSSFNAQTSIVTATCNHLTEFTVQSFATCDISPFDPVCAAPTPPPPGPLPNTTSAPTPSPVPIPSSPGPSSSNTTAIIAGKSSTPTSCLQNDCVLTHTLTSHTRALAQALSVVLRSCFW